MSDQIICHCQMVSREEVLEIIREKNPRSLAELIMLTGAGAGCGRCIPRLRLLLKNSESSGKKE